MTLTQNIPRNVFEVIVRSLLYRFCALFQLYLFLFPNNCCPNFLTLLKRIICTPKLCNKKYRSPGEFLKCRASANNRSLACLVSVIFVAKKLFHLQNKCCVLHSKWFEPRSISSSYSVIVRVRVVLKRTVVGD